MAAAGGFGEKIPAEKFPPGEFVEKFPDEKIPPPAGEFVDWPHWVDESGGYFPGEDVAADDRRDPERETSCSPRAKAAFTLVSPCTGA